ncbi:MAG: hypothetical protein RQ751_07045, partial [Longimicrobiales bacterium]|nr:hypothetical protein [Longimicrobiales bacterium]
MRPRTEDRVRVPAAAWAASALLAVGVLAAASAGWASVSPAPVVGPAAADTLQVGDRRCLTRRPEDCLEVPVPLEEPHSALCATCHTLWQRGPARETALGCADAGCHSDPAALAGFHRSVHTDVLENCLGCHDPHDAVIPGGGEDCVQCHAGGGARVAWAAGAPLHVLAADLPFRHGAHPGVSCQQCHETGAGHGDVAVSGVEDCRSCHHDA